MYDHSLFLRTVSDFTRTLLTPYDVDTVLKDLMSRLVEMLDLAGIGVALAKDGKLEFAAAVPECLSPLEHVQIQHQLGPSIDAFHSGAVVAVTDLSSQRDRWPDYCATACHQGLRSVAGIPMQLSGSSVGALDLYARDIRHWSEEDLAAAIVMADMATGYLINASKRRQQEQLTEQLQRALESKVIIEQAKGVIANAHNTTVDQAFDLIRQHARSHNVTVRAVAEAIVNLGLTV